VSKERTTCLRCHNALWRDAPDQEWQSFADRGPTCKSAPKEGDEPGKHQPR
jgi:hypothetical protein